MVALKKPGIIHLPVFQLDKPIAMSENLSSIVIKNKCSLKRAKMLYPTGDRYGDRFRETAE
jgi:hypothetical protein